MDQTQRETNKKILDRIASDPTFREELLDDPKGAMERAGFQWEGDEVAGYSLNSLGSILPIILPPINTVGTPGGGGVSETAPVNTIGIAPSPPANQDPVMGVSTPPNSVGTPPDGGH